MVRLRRIQRFRKSGRGTCFNPTMVRLRLEYAECPRERARSFNPTMVRLRPIQPLRAEDVVPCFNPTMVRLRHMTRSTKCSSQVRFNPTMVRLRLAPPPRREMKTKGVSIPLWCDCDWPMNATSQLKEARFNPTMVRLRQRYQAPFESCPECFNPTMVRLRPFARTHSCPCELVSIPLWCDCDHFIFEVPLCPAHVSIPLWCDCDSRCDRCGRRRYGTFQSHYGAIATPEIPDAHCTPRRISIPLWCDCDPGGKDQQAGGERISIPLWCDCDPA